MAAFANIQNLKGQCIVQINQRLKLTKDKQRKGFETHFRGHTIGCIIYISAIARRSICVWPFYGRMSLFLASKRPNHLNPHYNSSIIHMRTAMERIYPRCLLKCKRKHYLQRIWKNKTNGTECAMEHIEHHIIANVFSIITVLLQMYTIRVHPIQMDERRTQKNRNALKKEHGGNIKIFCSSFHFTSNIHIKFVAHWGEMSNVDEKNGWKDEEKSKLTAAIQWKCINSRKVVMFIRQSEEKKRREEQIEDRAKKTRICYL